MDEDCDGAISLLEFQTLYTRCRDDKTGYEPRGLFNVVEFVMNDKNNQGFITLEEAMQIMYLRYGRAELDMQLEQVFGTADLNSGKVLSLTEFLHCLHTNQVRVCGGGGPNRGRANQPQPLACLLMQAASSCTPTRGV